MRPRLLPVWWWRAHGAVFTGEVSMALSTAAKKDYAVSHMLSKTRPGSTHRQGKQTLSKGPRAGSAKYRGNKVGKYEQTSGSKTKLPNLR